MPNDSLKQRSRARLRDKVSLKVSVRVKIRDTVGIKNKIRHGPG